MRTNYYLTKEAIQVTDEFKIDKHSKVLGSLPDKNGMVMLFTQYWFQVPRKMLMFLEKFT